MDPLRLWETYPFKEVNFTPPFFHTQQSFSKNHWPMHRLYKTFWWKKCFWWKNGPANAPENRPKPNRKVVFQPSIFRGYVSFREGTHGIGTVWKEIPFFETRPMSFSSFSATPTPGSKLILVKFLRFQISVGPDSWCSNGWINLPKQGSQILFTSASESNKNEFPQNKMFWFFNFAGNPKHVNETFLLQPKTKICKWKKHVLSFLCRFNNRFTLFFCQHEKKGENLRMGCWATQAGEVFFNPEVPTRVCQWRNLNKLIMIQSFSKKYPPRSLT